MKLVMPIILTLASIIFLFLSDPAGDLGTIAGQAARSAIPRNCPEVTFSYSTSASSSSIGTVTLNQGKGWGVVTHACLLRPDGSWTGLSVVGICARDALPRANVNWDRVRVRKGGLGVFIQEC